MPAADSSPLSSHRVHGIRRIVWQCYLDGWWCDYDEYVCSFIESSWLRNAHIINLYHVGWLEHWLDLTNLMQENTKTGKRRPIRRVIETHVARRETTSHPIPGAWSQEQ